MTPIKLPNFFILGAGRSGTTTLYNVLKDHPQVFLPTPKEPTFFSEPFQVIRTPIRYASLFADADRYAAVGDASHAHLSHPDAAATIRAFFPDAKFVVTFRNPADRALAMYSYMLENGYEPLPTFERALAAEERRFASARFARNCPHYFWNFMYYRSGRFGEQIARYYEHYTRDRFFFTTLYDLQLRTQSVFDDLTTFLGIDPLPIGELPRYGSSKGVRSIPAQLLERKLLRPLARRHVPLTATTRDRLNTWNRGTPPTMRPETHRALVDRFRPDLEHLRTLTGIDVLGVQAAADQSRGVAPPTTTS
jgi:hypothetical protein